MPVKIGVVLALVTGGAFTLAEITAHVKAALLQRVAAHGYRRLYHAESQLTISVIASPGFDNRIRKARNALNHGSLTQFVNSLYGIAISILTATALALAMWHVSKWAAVFMVLSLLPVYFEYRTISKAITMLWDDNSENIRVAYYFEELLTSKRPLRELAGLQARSKVSERASQHRTVAGFA